MGVNLVKEVKASGNMVDLRIKNSQTGWQYFARYYPAMSDDVFKVVEPSKNKVQIIRNTKTISKNVTRVPLLEVPVQPYSSVTITVDDMTAIKKEAGEYNALRFVEVYDNYSEFRVLEVVFFKDDGVLNGADL